MGGARQFSVLLKKNLQLKTRRPCATCLELFSPVVLFLLLSYMRARYEIKTFGPFFFDNNVLFPLGSAVLFPDGLESQARNDVIVDQYEEAQELGCVDDCESAFAFNASREGILHRSRDQEKPETTQDFAQRSEQSYMLRDMERSLVCGDSFGTALASALEPAVTFALGDEPESLLQQDPEQLARLFNDTLRQAQDMNVTAMFDQFEEMRSSYFSSGMDKQAEDMARYIDQELVNFQAALNGMSASGDEAAREEARLMVERWVDDICGLRGLNFSANTTTFNLMIDNTSLPIDSAMLVQAITLARSVLTSEAELSSSTDGEMLADFLRQSALMVEIQDWTAGAADNSSDLELELIQLVENVLNMSDEQISFDARGIAEQLMMAATQLDDMLNESRSTNVTEELANQFFLLSRMVEDAGIADMIRTFDMSPMSSELSRFLDSVSNLTEMTREAQAMMDQMNEFANRAMGTVRATLNSTANVDLTEAASEEVADAAAQAVQDGAWWISHFLTRRSFLSASMQASTSPFASQESWDEARASINETAPAFMEETRTQLADMAYRFVMDLEAQLERDRQGVNREGPPAERTAEENLASLIDQMRAVAGMVNTTFTFDPEAMTLTGPNTSMLDENDVNVTDMMLQEVAGTNLTELVAFLDMLTANANASLDSLEQSSLFSNMTTFLDSIQNASVDEIRDELLPQWEEEWRTQCPTMLNKTAIGMFFEKTVDNCPWYRSQMAELQRLQLMALERVQEAHAALRELNMTEMRAQAESMQQTIQGLDRAGLTELAQRTLVNTALGISGEGDNNCLTPVEEGCASLTTESECLSSRSANKKGNGESCAWCGGEACTSESMSKCEPVQWLLSPGANFLARSTYTVAFKQCSVAEALSKEIQRQFADSRGYHCHHSEMGMGDYSSGGGGGPQMTPRASEYIATQLMNRKILVAPYKGEVKDLWDLVLVEMVLSLSTANREHRGDEETEDLKALLRCPVFRGLAASALKGLAGNQVLFFESEAELETHARENGDKVLLGVAFRSVDENGNFPQGELDVKYAVRYPATLAPSTGVIVQGSRSAMFGGGSTRFSPYVDLFFVHIQETIGRAVARMQAKRTLMSPGGSEKMFVNESEDAIINFSATSEGRNILANEATAKGRAVRVGVEAFPVGRYESDGFIRAIQHTLPMMVVLGWIYSVSLLVKEIVYEKQERLRDVMRIMGLKTWVYWASWMASAMIQLTALVTIMVIIMSASGILKHSDPTVIFVFFWLYSLSTASLSMLISSFFSRAKMAAACAGLGYYVMYMPYSFFNRFDDTLGLAKKNALCLFSSTALGIGMAMTAKWEILEIGVQWSNLFVPPPITYSGAYPQDSHSMGHVFMMLIIDTGLYQLLAWYIEKVYPGTLGLPQPFYFFLMPSYWFPKPTALEQVENDGNIAEKADNARMECHEPWTDDAQQVTVQIRKLSKTFSNGKKALSSVTLDMHKGTIVGLLGHNGAGKSTTMSILTGLYPPTSGDVKVNSVSVTKDSHGVRKQLGVCLQHNALYETITVEEHLKLFCCLKSVPWDKMEEEVTKLLTETGLLAKRHFQTKALSGGMKRKLSISIALAGGSSVITLDEPTAGVDATSRRDIWNVLSAHKAARTILLSTHFMDEADILSDRIAVIAEGQLTAIGTSLMLKRSFAQGYMLTVVVLDATRIHRLVSAVKAAVPEAKACGSRGREFSFILPFAARSSFANLFKDLQDDAVRESLGVDTYGLSAPTMEEVFLIASSSHEEGLHGIVRNALQDQDTPRAPSDEDSTAEGGSTNGSDKEKVTNTPSDSGSDNNKRPSESGSDKQPHDAGASDNSRPQSPQSMVDGGVTPRPAQPPVPKLEDPMPVLPSPKDTEKDHGRQVSPQQATDSVNFGPPLTGTQLWFHQFGALLRKRALTVFRDRKAWASQLLLPALFVLLALVVAKLVDNTEDAPPLKLTNEMYLGTLVSRRTTTSLKTHKIPMDMPEDDALSQEIEDAFMASLHRGNEGRPLPESRRMGEYLMYERMDLSDSFGAISMEEATEEEDPHLTLWHKAEGVHSVPAMVNFWNLARMKMLGFEEVKLETWNHPLPRTDELVLEDLLGGRQVYMDLTVAITLILAMGFIPASFVVYLVHEKSTNGKHQQLISGISPALYWLNSYFWDMLNFMMPLLCCFLIFECFQVAAYGGSNIGAVFLLLFLYGACMTPLMYCVEPLFTVASTAYVTLIVTNIFTGTISVFATTIMDMYENDLPEIKPTNAFCKAVFPWVLPNYCLGRGLIEIATNHYLNYGYETYGLCLRSGPDCTVDPVAWDVAGKILFKLAFMAPVWMLLRLLIEWGFCLRGVRQQLTNKIPYIKKQAEDEIVIQEAERVDQVLQAAKSSGTSVAEHLVITELAKSFPGRLERCGTRRGKPFHAVRGISVGVPPGECFGLLGVNGAGKTTTMRMITGDTEITHGDILVGGWSVHGNRDRARQHLGYCPQFDALSDKLTVRECLALYARIRGVSSANVNAVVQVMVERMCLEAHQRQLCQNLSGGNKRKLSTALALIGEPDVVLLDEPSTGVDVGARRFLWEVISGIRFSGKSVILTSHSMEECEALCTRLTIMVHGQFRCLGSPTELKAKYGGGYTMAVKSNINVKDNGATVDSRQKVKDYVAANIDMAECTEESVGLVRYQLRGQGSANNIPLADIFRKLEEATAEGGELFGWVLDYSLSQTSLEEVFLHFSQVGEREYAQEQGTAVELPTAVAQVVNVQPASN